MTASGKRRAVFLDRDGVLNRVVLRDGKPHPPTKVADLAIPPDVPRALRLLKMARLLLVVVTNQPDVARGTQSRAAVEAINACLAAQLPLDAFYVCCENGDDCPRRKPNPGMLLEAAATLGIDLRSSFMVGDRWKDVEAGRRAGCRTVFLDAGYAEKKPDPPADATALTLIEAATWILSCLSQEENSHAIPA